MEGKTTASIEHVISTPPFTHTLCITWLYFPEVLNHQFHQINTPKNKSPFSLSAHVTAVDVVHGQQVVAMAKLEVDDLQGGGELRPLLCVPRTTLHGHVLQQ